MTLQFSAKQVAGKVKKPAEPPKQLKADVPHKLVKVAKIASLLGVEVQIIHGYIRRGNLKAVYPAGSKVKHVYADEAVAAVRSSPVRRKRDREEGREHTIGEGALLSWNKGDGRRQVGLVGKPNSSGLVDVETTHKPFFALCEGLEEKVTKKQVVIENPVGVLLLVYKYLQLKDTEHAGLQELASAIRAVKAAETK